MDGFKKFRSFQDVLNTQLFEILSKEKMLTYADVPRFTLLMWGYIKKGKTA